MSQKELIKEFDVQTIRGQFPTLKEEINGRPVIYFDNAATTQKPLIVLKALEDYYYHQRRCNCGDAALVKDQTQSEIYYR